MKLDDRIVKQARNTDIIIYLEQYYGFEFAHRGGAYRCKQHPSFAVKSDKLSWYWHSKRVGGFGIIDYLMKIEFLSFRQAVEAVMGSMTITTPPRQEKQYPRTLVLPEKAATPIRLYDYLCAKRGIDSSIVASLIQKEKLYEDKRGNVVFIGFDEQGKPRFASLRGTYGDCSFRGDCAGSDKRYGFCMASDTPSNRLYIFESPIDTMSHGVLANIRKGDKSAWKRDNRLSLAGTADTALSFFLNQHKTVDDLVFCLDNDSSGQEAIVMLCRKYAEKGYRTRIELPEGKDFNEDLMGLIAARKAV
ncbi:MAG: DUF3991 and toprim domain-containing protein [Oscillospiraceae bacterium]|nr:DUF3991 and toprim domain-containing protein [Oscillospiraceae bacterium]